MKHLVTLFFLFPLFLNLNTAYAQAPPFNVTQVGHLAFPQGISDVWGYVDSLGNEWAIVGAQDGVSLVNLSNPANPTLAFHFPGISTGWRDIKTWGPWAYVTNEGGDGLRIIDLRDLPNSATSRDTSIAGMITGHNLYIDDGYAYTVGGNLFFGGIAIFDVGTDPENPAPVGWYNLAYVHDVYVRDNIAYAAEMGDGELTILDVSNKSNVTTLGSATWPQNFIHNTWLSDNDSVCFTTDELDYAYIRAFDVSDPQNIVELDRIRSSVSGGAAAPHNVFVHNDWLVSSYYADGLHVVDAHRPGNLVEVGHFDTNPQTGGGYVGMWGAYPFLPSGLVLGTDMTEGLFILDVDHKRASYLEGTVTDASTNNPIVNADISIVNTSINELSKTLGTYATGIADSGMFTVSVSKFGYLQQDTTLLLAPGQVAVWNPRLQPAPAVGLTVRVENAQTNQPIENAEVSATVAGMTYTYITNANGEINDPSIVPGTYAIIGGKWGFVTDGLSSAIDSSNNSVVLRLQPGYYDDFTFDFGWNVSGSATAGHWVRVEPTESKLFLNPVQTDLDVQDDWGDKCYVTGDGSGTAEDFDVDNGRTLLTSPVMDLSGTTNPYLIFDWYFLNMSNFGGTGWRDSLGIRIDNGNAEKLVWFRSDMINNVFVRDTVKIANWIVPTATMTVKFFAEDNLFDHIVEAAVDRFMVVDQQTVEVPEVASAEMTIYPNPSRGDFVLRYDLGGYDTGVFELYDLKGRIVRRQELTAGAATVQLSGDMAPGLYFGKLRSGEAELGTVKVIRW